MSTRATIAFRDENAEFTVYRHSDGYPQSSHGVLHTLRRAFPLAWPLPRFEADEFATATVAAWKTSPGNIRLTSDRDSHADTEYHYEVSRLREQAALYAKVYARTGDDAWTPLAAARLTADRVKPLPLSKADALARKRAGLDTSETLAELDAQDEYMPLDGPAPASAPAIPNPALAALLRAMVAQEVARQVDHDGIVETALEMTLAALRDRLS